MRQRGQQEGTPASRAVGGRPLAPRAPRLGLLDLLRLVAAVAVVLYHYTATHPEIWHVTWPGELFRPVSEFTKYGYLGVDLFFFISGFVILMTAWDRSLVVFIASRASRLFPAYLAATVITGVLVFVTDFVPFGFKDRQVEFFEIVGSLTMVQHGRGLTPLEPATWTLWAELRFYLIVAVLISLGITRGRTLALAFVWPIVGGMAMTQQDHFFAELLLGEYAPYFAAGMVLYLVYREGHTLVAWALIALNVALAMVEAGKRALAVQPDSGGPLSPNVCALLVLALFATVTLVVLTPLRRLHHPALTWAGALTYPLYVLHQDVGLVIVQRAMGAVSPWVAVALAIAGVLVLAALLHAAVERPTARPLRRRLERELESARR